MQLGGGSKDTWVIGGTESHPAVHIFSHRGEPHAAGIPSRVADNMFWLGRYGERVESGVRMVRALLPGLSGEEDFGHSASVGTALQLLLGLGYIPEDAKFTTIPQKKRYLAKLLSAMTYDASRKSGLRWNLDHLRRVAWPVKERLSNDTWRVLQQLDAAFALTPPVGQEMRVVAQMNLLDRAILMLAAFSGLLMENTTRSQDWLFLEIGRRVERSLQIAEILSASTAQAEEENDRALSTLLQIADSSITYRTRYLTDLRVEFILELLLRDEINPRSIGFQLVTLVDHVRLLPDTASNDGPSPRDLASAILAQVRNANLKALAEPDKDGDLAELNDLMRRLKGNLYDLSELLSARHFSHQSLSRLEPLL